MADQTFYFRVSGVEVGDAVKERIASEFAILVTRAIVEAYPDVAEGDVWSRCRINGGMIYAPEVGNTITTVLENVPDVSLDYGASDIGLP
jgi:hypothetical protein